VDEKQNPRRSPKGIANRKDELEERLRKARERSRTMNGPDETPKTSKFIPYNTMFKLQELPRPENGVANNTGRTLICVSCGSSLPWRIYSVAPNRMDAECPMCHTKASDFWKGKLHKELDTDA